MHIESTREDLIKKIAARGNVDARILKAISAVPREEFVPRAQRKLAYRDVPLPIGHGQTISQPSLVAQMTAQLNLRPESRVLEVGTGCGYQTAILCELAAAVYTVEVRQDLGRSARERLTKLGYTNVKFKIGDGTQGWSEHAPFEAIIVTAAGEHAPAALIDQLMVGGRMVIPLGPAADQALYLYEKTEGGFHKRKLLPVRFVPLVSQDPNYS